MTPSDKRPFALTSALILSLFFGFADVGNGCGRAALYRLAGQGPTMEELAVGTEDRANVLAAFTEYVAASDAAHTRLIPLAAAAIVLGMAAVFFTLRAFARVPGSRNMLWQLVLAQTLLVVGSHFALPALRSAEIAREAAVQRARLPEAHRANTEEVMKMMPKMQTGALAIRAILGVLIVVVLNRKSTRAYYDAALAPSEHG